MATESVKYVCPRNSNKFKDQGLPKTRSARHRHNRLAHYHRPQENWFNVWLVSPVFPFVGWSRGIAYPFAIVGSQHGGSH